MPPPANAVRAPDALAALRSNITSELKMAARRRGEDIIDFGMGNPDGPTPKHIVDKLIETVSRPTRTATRCRRAPGCAARSAIGMRAVTASNSIRSRSDRHDRLEGGHRVPRTRDAESWRHGARPEPELPNPHLRPGHRRCGHPACADDARRRLFRRARAHDPHEFPKPKMLIINFPSNPTAQCVELPFFEKTCTAASTDLRRPRSRVRRHLLRRLEGASIMQVPAREVAVELHDVEELATAIGESASWSEQGLVALADQGLPRLRHVHADPGGRNRRTRRPAGGCRHRAALPEAARRPVKACTRLAGWSTTRRRRCTCGRRFRGLSRG